MRFSFPKIIKWLFPVFIFLAFFIQLGNFLSFPRLFPSKNFIFNGINPDLVLIFCLLGIFWEINPLFYFLPFFLSLFYPNFIWGSLIIGVESLFFSYFKKFLTGNIFLDFSFTLVASNFLIYLILDRQFIFQINFLQEITYNLILGVLILLCCFPKKK